MDMDMSSDIHVKSVDMDEYGREIKFMMNFTSVPRYSFLHVCLTHGI